MIEQAKARRGYRGRVGPVLRRALTSKVCIVRGVIVVRVVEIGLKVLVVIIAIGLGLLLVVAVLLVVVPDGCHFALGVS